MLIILFLVLHFNFLFVPCGRLSWLPVSFLLHVKHTLSDQFRTAQSSNSMESAEHEPITGVWGGAPSEGPGGQPPEAECFFVFACPNEAVNLPHYWYLQKSANHTVNEPVIDASPTNLHVVTSTISTYSCPWIQTSLTCAPAQFVVFHSACCTQTECSWTPCPKKVHLLTFDGNLL